MSVYTHTVEVGRLAQRDLEEVVGADLDGERGRVPGPGQAGARAATLEGVRTCAMMSAPLIDV